MIEERPAAPSVAALIATSARRARVLAVLQAIALIAIIAGRWQRAAAPPLPVDAAIDAALPGGDAAPLLSTTPDPPCADPLACQSACEGGVGLRRFEACVRWADMLRTGTAGAPRDRVAARDLYREVCLAIGDATACTHLALRAGLLHDLDLAPDWIDPALAPLGMLAATCDADPGRGRLACAALELLKAPPAIGRDGRGRLCRDGAAELTGCAAGAALEACQGSPADAEACYLAAGAGLPTAAAASTKLAELCRGTDRAACLYRSLLSSPAYPDRDSLGTACSELESEKTASIASACVLRAQSDPRSGKFATLACELGTCQDRRLPPPPPPVLKRACDAKHVNGCANLIFARRTDPAARRTILDQVAVQSPQFGTRVADDPPADRAACALGSVEGCTAAIARLSAAGASADDKQLAARLGAYRARLLAPLGAP